MSVGGLASNIYDWTMTVAVIGVIVLMVYAIFSTITFLVLSSRVSSSQGMDKLTRFTGQDAVVTNRGIVKVIGRLMGTLIICSFILSGGGFLLIRIIYDLVMRFYFGIMG